MEFTYNAVIELLHLIKQRGYEFCDYSSADETEKAVILRHDVDLDVEAAYRMAKIENNLGIKSTYFFLVGSEFYNLLSKKTEKTIRDILLMGHQIGLHFDPMKYYIKTENDYIAAVTEECSVLRHIFGDKTVCVFSIHRPSKNLLDSDISVDGIINAYSNRFFKEYEYFSDSRMYWKKDVLSAVNGSKYNRMQILIHPIWYADTNSDIIGRLSAFCADKQAAIYENLNDNISDFNSIIPKESR